MSRAIWVAGGVLAVLVLIVLGEARKRHGTLPLLWRWLSGHALDGAHRTDAGWFSAAENKLGARPVSRWHYLPRAHRAAWRTGGTLAALGAAWGLPTHQADTLHALGAVAVVAVGLGLWQGWRRTRAFRHVRAHVRPLHHALGAALSIPAATRPAAWLDVPIGYAKTQGALITVHLPKRFAPGGDARRAVEQVVCAKLGLVAPSVAWLLEGAKQRVEFTVQIPPPGKVGLAAARMLIAETAITAPLLGIGRGGRPVYADFDADSPHALISAGSGAGKSVTTRTMVAQVLNKGGVALILDFKRFSQTWARGLPNVRYCKDIAQIHEALLWLSAEVDARTRLADDGADDEGNTDGVNLGPRIIVLAEEMNATVNRLAAYWRTIKGKIGRASCRERV